MKNLLFYITFLCYISSPSQNEYNKFWNQLLSNDRISANKTFKNIKSKKDVRYLITKSILREENGTFSNDDSFLDSFLNQEDVEYYLYALWNETYLLNTYLEIGFNKKNKNALEAITNAKINNTTIKDAVIYLNTTMAREQRDYDKFKIYNDALKAIKKWQYCGVFENLNESGLDRYYAPEDNAISETPFNAESNGLVNWYKANSKNEAYQFFSNHEEYGSGVNYAQTFINAPSDEEVVFRVGCGSAFKLWLNDVLIYENSQDVTTELNAYQVKVNLPKGNNRLLIKTAESNYGSYFIVSPFTKDGKHNTTLSYSNDYKAYNKSTKSTIKAEIIANEFETFFENKLKNNPNDFFYAYCLINTYLRNSRYAKAKKAIAPFVEKYPKSSLVRTLQVSIYSVEKDYTKTEELKKNIELDDPDYYYPVLLKAIDSKKLNRMTIEELDVFLNKLKENIDMEIMHVTADFMYSARKKDMGAVKKNLDLLMKFNADNVKNTVKFAPLYSNIFKEDKKTLNILETLNEDYFYYPAITKLTRIYESKDQKEKVLELIKKDYKYLYNTNFYIKNIARKLQKYQKYEESLEYIEKGLKNFPYSFVLYELKGDALFQINNKQDALLAYEISLKHNNNHTALRKKIKDLKKEPNLVKELIEEKNYTYVEDERGKIENNNYGFNILKEDIVVELYKDGGGNYRSVYLYEITSDSGVESFKEYNLGLSGNYNIIKSEIIKKDKSIVPADKSGSSFMFNGLSIGDVIYLDYESTFSQSGRFYNDYTDRFMLGSFHPMKQSSLRIITPKNYKFDYKIINGDTPLKKSKKGDYILYEWSKTNVLGLKQGEDYMPSDVDVAEYIHISTIKDWNEISTWYSDLVRSRMEVNDNVNTVFNQLFPKGYKQLSENERSKIIYNYIRNNFNYSYVSFRQSGFIPQKPSKTITTKLGDCKDFSTLFVTLAKKAELKANLVLILTSDYGENNLVLPSTDFNHCIAKVNIQGKDQFLELTDKYLPYKSLPVSLRGATGLEIPIQTNAVNKTYDLFKLDNVAREKSIGTNEIDVFVKQDHIEMNIVSGYTGHINSSYASVLSEPNPEVLKKAIYDDFNGRLKDEFVLNTLKDIKRLDDDNRIEFTSEISIDKKISKIGKTSILQLPIVTNPYTSSIISLEKREYPIEYIQYENMDAYFTSYNIYVNDDQKFTEIPDNIDLKFKGHQYEMVFELKKDNHLKVSIKANTPSNRISSDAYSEFKTYVKQILEAEDAFIGFKAI